MSTRSPRDLSKEQLAALQAKWNAGYLGIIITPNGKQPYVSVTRTPAENQTDVVVCVFLYPSGGGNHLQQAYDHEHFYNDGETHVYLGPTNAPGQYDLVVGVYKPTDWFHTNGNPPFSWNDLGNISTY